MSLLRSGCICLALILGWQGLPALAQDSTEMNLPPDEYNAYEYASKQPEAADRAADLEDFLGHYAQTTIKKTVLNQLIADYLQLNLPDKALEAATRMLEVDPNDMKAIYVSVTVDKEICQKSLNAAGAAHDLQPCDDARTLAQKGLTVAKPADIADADWKKTTDEAYPAYHSALAFDDFVSKKDFAAAIEEYTAGLKLYPPDECSKPGPCFEDTLQLAQAYAQPGPAHDEAKAAWFFARAWDFAPQEYETQIEQQLDYWYLQCRGTLESQADIKAQIEYLKGTARASLLPPSDFKVDKAANPADTAYPGNTAGSGTSMHPGNTEQSNREITAYSSCPFCVTSAAPTTRPTAIAASGILENRSLPGAYTSANAAGARREIGLEVAGNNASLPANVHPVYTIPEESATGVVHENGAAVPSHFGRLNQQGAATVIQKVNTARSSMKGINRIPLPAGSVYAQPNGSLTITSARGHFVQVRADGTVSSVRSLPLRATSSGVEGRQEAVLFNRTGKIVEVHSPSIDIYHGPHGIRTIVARRPEGKVLVSTGPHSGYLEENFSAGGVSYLRRSYLAGRSRAVRIYRAYDYHGHRYFRYIPARRYPAEFYEWTRKPWYPPVIYRWHPNPPDTYGHYYATSIANLNVSDWITDYVFIGIFDDADQMDGEDPGSDQNAAGSQDSGDGDTVYADRDTLITPELRQAIAAEVQEQLNEEAAVTDPSDQGPQGPGTSDEQEPGFIKEWTPNRYFVAGNPIEVATGDGHTCLLDAGNVLRLDSAPSWPPHVKLTVVASRRADCPVDTRVNVPVDQLAEMDNSFRARLDDGLQTLYSQQSQNGLPAIPDSVKAIPQSMYAAPADDGNLRSLLTEQQSVAAQAETDARNFAVAELASAGQQ